MESDRQGYFNSRILFWGFGISLLLNKSNTNFWISILVGFVFGLITLLLVPKNIGSSFSRRVSGFVFTILGLIVLSYMSSTLYLKETPLFILALFALVGAFIISGVRDKSYFRTVSLLFIVSIFMYIVSRLFLIKDANPINILPLFNSSFKGVLYGSLIFYLYSITPLLCLNDTSDKVNLVTNYIIASISILVTSTLVVLVLGMKEALIYRYPEYVLLKRIKFFDFFSNVDNIFLLVMILDSIITITSGIRSMKLSGNLSKSIVFITTLFSTVFLANDAGTMALVYNYLPFILAFLLLFNILSYNKK